MDTGEHREGNERLVQISKLIRDYRDTLGLTAETCMLDIVNVLALASRVFIAGNGGSASTAIHFASDLRAVGVTAISLCENISVITRIANDESYSEVFACQLREFNLGETDALVLISVSGNSTNIREAAVWAQGAKAIVIGFIGSGGGKLERMCDYHITLESRDFGVVEGLHSCFCHMISQMIKGTENAHE